MKKTTLRIIACGIALILLMLCCGCSTGRNGNPGNYPYEPDIPAPDPHDGVFVSEHGTMTFNGDDETVAIDFDAELAAITGLPEGEHKCTYVFLSGNLPPNGSFPIRYDAAHEMEITVDGVSAVISMGIAAEDGSNGQVGIDVVTPERIPMLFRTDGTYFNVVFLKEGAE